MVSPRVTPDEGIGIYSRDRTQGPACAIACAAGTVYRNCFVPLGDQSGQSAARQLDGSSEIGVALGNEGGSLWQMKNGYLLPTSDGLKRITSKLFAMAPDQLDELRGKLRIGVQSGTQVTLADCRHLVTRMYCSALPVAYCNFPDSDWIPFVQLVLDAAYEATFCAAIVNAAQTGNRTLYLTLLGGGAFGNDLEWILAAIQRSLGLLDSFALDVRIVSFRESKPEVRQLVSRFS